MRSMGPRQVWGMEEGREERCVCLNVESVCVCVCVSVYLCLCIRARILAAIQVAQ